MAEVKEPPKLLYRNHLPLKEKDIIPQGNFQEDVLLSDANITIIGGSRGAGKSFSLVLDPLYDISNSNFSAMFFRKETSQIQLGLYDEALKIYPMLGAKMTKLRAVFPSGATITYEHLQNESVASIEARFKGLSIPAFYFDEIDQQKFDTIKRVMESNRNPFGIRNRIIGTCNPAPESWLRTFIDWYVGSDGLIDPLRDRKMRYFYIYGTEVNDIIWGNSKEEVIQKASSYIEDAWNPAFAESGLTRHDMIKSLVFIRGDLSSNKILLKNDPNYLASVSQGGASSIARNLKGNWDVPADGEEMVTRSQMDLFFNEYREAAIGDGTMFMSIDVALMGLDLFVLVIWKGLHVVDVVVKDKLDSAQAVEVVSSMMNEYGVREENIFYDSIGNGQALSCFKRAVPIFAQAAPVGAEIAYDSLKSQILYYLGKYLIEGKLTCSTHAANKLFKYGKGLKREKLSFKEIMQNERRALMIEDSPGKTKMKNKKQMKALLGQSPDFLEAVAYRMMGEFSKKKKGSFQGLEFL
jgi:hypothetical protein